MTESDEMMDDLRINKQVTILSEQSAEDYVHELIKRTTRSESVNVFEVISDGSSVMPSVHFGHKRRINRSGSACIPPKINESLLEQSQRFIKTDSALFLKERGIMRYFI